MRRIILLSLLGSLFCATTVEARLFWQTYGAVIPNESGCGNTWNWNQDYFVPRHPSSCQYELYSPCKTSRSTSPACHWCHPLYPGYCGIYGPSHYRRKNHVHESHCGCSPLCVCGPKRVGRSRDCCVQNCCNNRPVCGEATAMCPPGFDCVAPLPNVEAPGLEMLGSVSAEGDGLLPNASPAPSDAQQDQQSLGLPQLLNTLGLPETAIPIQALPAP